MRIETDLAKASLDIVSRRDPNKVYHKMSVKALLALAPSVDWPKYFSGVGAPSFTDLECLSPGFFQGLECGFYARTPRRSEDLSALAIAARGSARYLSKAFVEENFHFYGKTLPARQELQPRWKRCVDVTR